MLCKMAHIFSLFTPHTVLANTLSLRIMLQSTPTTLLPRIRDPLRLLMLPGQPTILLTNMPPNTYKLLLPTVLHLHSSLYPLGHLSNQFHVYLPLLRLPLRPRMSLSLLGCHLSLLTFLALHIIILSLLMTLQSFTLLLVLLMMLSR